MKPVVLFLIRGYQKTQPVRDQLFMTFLHVHKVCRYSPSCSEYTYEAVEKYGALKGLMMGAKRISKCHPFHPGGYDPVR